MDVYVVDAFTREPLAGNPAAVVLLDEWLDDDRLQAMAAEHNLSETAYLVRSSNPEADYHIRWMTPAVEVKLCGHATLASAHVLWRELGFDRELIRLESKSGILNVSRDGEGRIVLDFPMIPIVAAEAPPGLIDALGATPIEFYDSYDFICVFDSQEKLATLDPDFGALARVEGARAIGCTAPGTKQDFVARLFAPRAGINEDPVTGSLYTMLAPYWARRLGKTKLTARQISHRPGDLWVEHAEQSQDRVFIAGHGATYMRGVIAEA